MFRCFGRAVFGRKSNERNLPTANLGEGQEFTAGFMGKVLRCENSFPARFAKDFLGNCRRRILEVWVPSGSGVFQDENAAIIERDLQGLAKSGVGQTSW